MSRWTAALLCWLMLTVGLTVSGCGSDDALTSGSSQATATDRAPTAEDGALVKTENGENEVSEIRAVAERSKPKVRVPSGPPPNDLVVEDLSEGAGAPAKDNDVVEINYVGVLYKNGKEFENTYDTHDPLYLRIGAGEVIPGWEQGLKGMKVGGRRELIIPARLGFKPGQARGVPAGEAIVYVIDLIKTETAPNSPQSRLDGAAGAEEAEDGSG